MEPSEYGDPFIDQAKAMIGSVMAIPVRETVIGFVLLTYGTSWKGVATEFWMLSGLAIRLAIDMGLHLVSLRHISARPDDKAPETGITDEEAKKDRLVFWTVMMLDFVVSLGVGRSTMIAPQTITQFPPFMDDTLPGSPLVQLGRLVYPMAQINNALNTEQGAALHSAPSIEFLKNQIVAMYASLPASATWSTQK